VDGQGLRIASITCSIRLTFQSELPVVLVSFYTRPCAMCPLCRHYKMLFATSSGLNEVLVYSVLCA
jgi:hypothetical protein